eukprot:2206007-Rhodomonas_salina.1
MSSADVGFGATCATSMVGFSLLLNFSTAALWAVTSTSTPEIFPTKVRTPPPDTRNPASLTYRPVEPLKMRTGIRASIDIGVRALESQIWSLLSSTETWERV